MNVDDTKTRKRTGTNCLKLWSCGPTERYIKTGLFGKYPFNSPANFFTLQTTNLLADIGGQLGLWIGISALTCGEILELIFQLLALVYTKFKNRKQNRVVEIGQTTEWTSSRTLPDHMHPQNYRRVYPHRFQEKCLPLNGSWNITDKMNFPPFFVRGNWTIVLLMLFLSCKYSELWRRYFLAESWTYLAFYTYVFSTSHALKQ
jgi:hypothetical protein